MPQLRMLGRRWRLASDMLPLMAIVFVIIHVAILVPVFTMYAIGRGGYSCPQESLVEGSILTTLLCHLIALVHDAVMVVVGLRGGPFEEKRRRSMPTMMVSRIFVYLLTLAAVILSTVLVYSPTVQDNCFAGDPCKAVAGVCENGRLIEACRIAYEFSPRELQVCRTQWFNLAATYAVVNYNASYLPHYPDGGIAYDGICNVSITAVSEAFKKWQEETGQYFPPYRESILPGQPGDDAVYVGTIWADDMGMVPENVTWNGCLDGACQGIAAAPNECPGYNALIAFGEDSPLYRDAQGVVWGSWAILILVLAIFIFSFNAFPDYSKQESWTGSVRSLSRMLCFSSLLDSIETEDGTTAAEGLGELLFKLFGSIDLDMTDKILGLYLVSERQQWRRFTVATSVLSSYGYEYTRKRRGLSCCRGSLLKRKKALKSRLQSSLDGESLGVEVRKLVPCPESFSASYEISFLSPKMYHSFARLAGEDVPTEAEVIQSMWSAPQQEHIESDKIVASQAAMRTLQTMTLEFDSTTFLTPAKFSHGAFEPQISAPAAANVYLGSPTSYVPKETLEDCLKLSWFAKASYGLQTVKWKDAKTGNWCLDTLDMCLDCLKSIGAKVVVKNHFRKRNLNAIINYTGIDPADILHVSYTNTAMGILPYMVVVDRSSQNIIISVRGTVNTDDMITDLMSHPKDCRSSLPEWVLREIYGSEHGWDHHGTKQDKIYCHGGMLSSAKAILADLDSKDLLTAMEGVTRSFDDECILETLGGVDGRIYREEIDDLGQEDDVCLPLGRAQSVVHEAAEKGWGLVVTGHSLGAAVASIISFSLIERFSFARCVVFNPPGGVMDPRLAELSNKFCTSVVVGFDGISRLSISNVRMMIDDMVLALGRCKRAKLAVFCDAVLGRRQDPSSAPPTFCDFQSIDDEAKSIISLYLETSRLHATGETDIPLHPPGKIVFLRPHYEMGSSKPPSTWDALYVRKEDLMDEGILILKEMLVHHHIYALQEALQAAMKHGDP
ncbi:Sn1-specific diacylglycerol lipase alpha [Picochlorum sp. SENEW3]|nr:Sn1-specific diacylglycerol lipase alpha [Picochlorum sp. SENEW3]WPT15953.1 Sn1-specific diacylglycerol lipase alpha [Picochlorum sp. SENEW3]